MLPSDVKEKVTSYFKRFIPNESSIVVGVSGGSDSVALIYLLCELRASLKIKKLAIAHVNHGLRGEESDQDEEFVRGIAVSLGVPFFTKRLSGRDGSDSGIEQWARDERYRFFRSLQESSGYQFVATGHTMDDQAETVFMRILRGTGHRGLRGIIPLREDGVIRPLLFTRKKELADWLKTINVCFRTDSSNACTKFRRNQIRHSLIPELEKCEPDIVENLSVLTEQLQGSWNVVIREVNKWIDSFVVRSNDYSFAVKKEGLQDWDCMSVGLREIFEEYGIPVTRFHIRGVFENGSRHGNKFLLPGRWCYIPNKKEILFSRTNVTDNDFCYDIALPGVTNCKEMNMRFVVEVGEVSGEEPCGNEWSVMLDRETCGDSLIFRKAKVDDSFFPFGRASETTLLRFLAKQGIPKSVRERMGVVVDCNNRV
ncbi:MAG: tRNA lysidine(34) synthetase TilS, partial [Fibrobacter sp.]|nr:tRNA lysidine(34) synthetase TilS [Fibrobacter sp.]